MLLKFERVLLLNCNFNILIDSGTVESTKNSILLNDENGTFSKILALFKSLYLTTLNFLFLSNRKRYGGKMEGFCQNPAIIKHIEKAEKTSFRGVLRGR